MTHYAISSSDPISRLIKSEGIKSWEKLIAYVQNLPYGRNRSRGDFKLVMIERKGTCSSKHAFLKTVADLNKIPDIELVLGMYRMNSKNTPRIGNTIEDAGLDYIPEAHCYLKMNGERVDITSPNSSFDHIKDAIIEELSIEPEQVNEFKVNYHQEFLKRWLDQEKIDKSFEEIWSIRESCIHALSENR